MALALNAGSNIRKCGMWGCSGYHRCGSYDDHGHRMSYTLVMTNMDFIVIINGIDGILMDISGY